MKKLIFILLLISPIITLKASDTWSEWQTEVPTGENIIVEKEERYKWYKVEENVSYVNIENEDICEYFDNNDYIMSDWVVSYDLPEFKKFRLIKTIKFEQNLNTNIIGTLHIFNIISNEILYITEVQVLSNNEILNYIISDKTDFQIQNFDKLNDNNIEEIALDFENYDKISITFDYLRQIENMQIKLFFINNNMNIKELGIATGHEQYNYLTFQVLNENKFDLTCNDTICELTINLKDVIIDKSNYNNFLNIYEYQDKLFKCVNQKKIYLEGYYTNIDNYIKDESTKKTYYRYKTEYTKTLNNANNIVYYKDLTLENDQEDENNIEKKDDQDNVTINSKLNENTIKKAKTVGKINYNIMLYLILTLATITIIYIIIKKIVNKNRAK